MPTTRRRPELARTCCKANEGGYATDYHRVNLGVDEIVLIKQHFEWLLSNGTVLKRRRLHEAIVGQMAKHLVQYRRLPPL